MIRQLAAIAATIALIACSKPEPLPTPTPAPSPTATVIEKLITVEVIKRVRNNLVDMTIIPSEYPMVVVRYDTDSDGVADLFEMRLLIIDFPDLYFGPVLETRYDRDQDGEFDTTDGSELWKGN